MAWRHRSSAGRRARTIRELFHACDGAPAAEVDGDHRRVRRRQVAPRMGVREVRRRSRRRRLVASRSLPLVRGRSGVLGAGRGRAQRFGIAEEDSVGGRRSPLGRGRRPLGARRRPTVRGGGARRGSSASRSRGITGAAWTRDELFAGWRRFVECLGGQGPRGDPDRRRASGRRRVVRRSSIISSTGCGPARVRAGVRAAGDRRHGARVSDPDGTGDDHSRAARHRRRWTRSSGNLVPGMSGRLARLDDAIAPRACRCTRSSASGR